MNYLFYLVCDIFTFILWFPNMVLHNWIGHRKMKIMHRTGIDAETAAKSVINEMIREAELNDRKEG